MFLDFRGFQRFFGVLSESLSEADFPLRGSRPCCPSGCCPLIFLQRAYPAECGEQLGRPCFKEFSGEGTLWDSSLPVTLTLWDTPVLCTPLLPLSQFFCLGDVFRWIFVWSFVLRFRFNTFWATSFYRCATLLRMGVCLSSHWCPPLNDLPQPQWILQPPNPPQKN